MRKPFAIELYQRYLEGESAEQLAHEMGIPLERIELRLQAAAIYLEWQSGNVLVK